MASPTPVLVGIAQILQRTDDHRAAKEPLGLMVDAVRAAAEDAGSLQLLERAGSVRVVRGVWRYSDPGRVVADAIGVPNAETGLTPYGGNCVQNLVNRTCLDIQAGKQDVVILTGGECGRSFMRAKKAGDTPVWSEAPGQPDVMFGEEFAMINDIEAARSIGEPTQVYPMFENALRYANGLSIEDHLKRISTLWAGFSEVASKNPNAWIQDRKTAEEIATPGPNNRAISHPYTMLMNSNSRVDMGAALILTSEETALALGIPREKFVYPYAGTDAHDHKFVTERQDLHSSPAIRIAGNRCLELAGVEAGNLDYRDLYSCFPSAVQVAAQELGLGLDVPLTVTGGLTFGGGPLNNYVMHGIARMAEVLRAEPGTKGLCTANGGLLSKHAFGVYSTEPPERPFQHADTQAEVDALPKREGVLEFDGDVTIETYTVMYQGGDPAIGYAACLLPDGRRTWGQVTDKDAAAAMTQSEFCGRTARISKDGVLEVGA
jgi:acetyl-CoA C-acetyltransferase